MVNLKRLFDFVVAILGIVILSPLFLIIVVLVRIKLGSPVFFSQLRPSIAENSFKLIKFRTMLDTYDNDGNLLPDSIRLTSFGYFLRSTSLDELPELWNVLRGEMSLVGPRPLLLEYLPLYSKEQARRHEVKSGLTGWAQVNGRNSLSWEEKFKLDVWYVDNNSFRLDLLILIMTFKKVLLRDGISAKGHEPMPPFEGSELKVENEK
jgi:lipopolysaccharide/colanic/teichoic acid biosynthesis glycosyltransferase